MATTDPTATPPPRPSGAVQTLAERWRAIALTLAQEPAARDLAAAAAAALQALAAALEAEADRAQSMAQAARAAIAAATAISRAAAAPPEAGSPANRRLRRAMLEVSEHVAWCTIRELERLARTLAGRPEEPEGAAGCGGARSSSRQRSA